MQVLPTSESRLLMALSNPIKIISPPLADGDSLAAFLESGRSWHSTFDPCSNSFAVAVQASLDHASTRQGNSGFEKSKQRKLGAPDAYVYVCGVERFPTSRRQLITETFVRFSGLQKMLNDQGDPWEDDEDDMMRLEALRGRPSQKWCQYYQRVAESYLLDLKVYLDSLPSTSQDELSYTEDLHNALSLATTIFLPRDGDGRGLVGEEVLDWLNTAIVRPSQDQLNKFVGLSAPYEHEDFWSTLVTCVMRGLTKQAVNLLKPLVVHPNQAFASLFSTLSDLLTNTPRYPTFETEQLYLNALRHHREDVRNFSYMLDANLHQVASVSRGAGALTEDDLDDVQASVALLLSIMVGEGERVVAAADDWKEALGAWLLWTDPFKRRDDLPSLVERIATDLPVDTSDPLEALYLALLSGDAPAAIGSAVSLSSWLSAHLSDLLTKLGALTHDPSISTTSLRDYCVLDYGETLKTDPGLWRLVVDYWATCGSEGEGRARALLRRITVDVDEVDDEDGQNDPKESNNNLIMLDGVMRETVEVQKEHKKGAKGQKVGVKEVMEVCREWGMEAEASRLARIQAVQLMKQRRYGAAISFCVGARDEKQLQRVVDRILDEYITNGPDEFIRLVDEIPQSLLHPAVHLIRPDLFSSLSDPINQFGQTTNETAPDAVPSSLGRSLSFLGRFRDMHSSYAKGQKGQAANLLVGMLSEEIAPKRWWPVLLLDVVPLLEDEQMLIASQDTYELLRCLEIIVGPILATSSTSLTSTATTKSRNRDIYGYLDTLKQIIGTSNTKHSVVAPTSSFAGTRNGNGSQIHVDEEDTTEVALNQLQIVRHALSRHLGRCIAGRF